MTIKHAFVSGKSDGADASLVRPSNWNADHVSSTAPSPTLFRSSTTPAATLHRSTT